MKNVDIDKLIDEYYESDIHKYYKKHGQGKATYYSELKIDNTRAKLAGKQTVYLKKGVHSLSKKELSDNGSKGGKVSGKNVGLKLKNEKKGIFSIDYKTHCKNAKMGGNVTFKNKVGIFALSNDEIKKYTTRGGNKTAEKLRKEVLVYDKITNEFIGEFKSMTDAAIELNCYKTHISSCCLGKSKSHKGYIFKFKS